MTAATEQNFEVFRRSVQDLVIKTGVRFLIYVMLGVIIFGGVGIWASTLLATAEVSSPPRIVLILAAVALAGTYLVLGILSGLVLALMTTVMKGLITMKEVFHTLVAPFTARIIESVPLGREGIPLSQFRQIVESTQIRALSAPPQSDKGFSSLFKIVYRWLRKFVLKAAHVMFLKDFTEQLEGRGATRVDAPAVEQFAREYFVEQLLDLVRWRIGMVRFLVIGAAALLLLIPIWLAG
jgi:hypothetical protein